MSFVEISERLEKFQILNCRNKIHVPVPDLMISLVKGFTVGL